VQCFSLDRLTQEATGSDLPPSISLVPCAVTFSRQIVPAQVTLDLLKAAMGEQSGPYLIQGWPKTLDNLDAFELQCGACAGAICLDGDEAILTARLLDRSQTSGRTDDSAEAISRRFQTFKLQSMRVLEALDRRGHLRRVNASGSVDEVLAAACIAFDTLAL